MLGDGPRPWARSSNTRRSQRPRAGQLRMPDQPRIVSDAGPAVRALRPARPGGPGDCGRCWLARGVRRTARERDAIVDAAMSAATRPLPGSGVPSERRASQRSAVSPESTGRDVPALGPFRGIAIAGVAVGRGSASRVAGEQEPSLRPPRTIGLPASRRPGGGGTRAQAARGRPRRAVRGTELGPPGSVSGPRLRGRRSHRARWPRAGRTASSTCCAGRSAPMSRSVERLAHFPADDVVRREARAAPRYVSPVPSSHQAPACGLSPCRKSPCARSSHSWRLPPRRIRGSARRGDVDSRRRGLLFACNRRGRATAHGNHASIHAARLATGRCDGRDRGERRGACAGRRAAAHQRAGLPACVRADGRQGGLRRGRVRRLRGHGRPAGAPTAPTRRSGRRSTPAWSPPRASTARRSSRPRGWATPDHLHPVQHEMAVRGGSQCGYCTPGFVCSMAAEFYRSGRDGFDIHALSGNLCRCTGYRPRSRTPPTPSASRTATTRSLPGVRRPRRPPYPPGSTTPRRASSGPPISSRRWRSWPRSPTRPSSPAAPTGVST